MRLFLVGTLALTACSHSQINTRTPAANSTISADRAVQYLQAHESSLKYQAPANIAKRLFISDFEDGFSQVCYGAESDFSECWVLRDEGAEITNYFLTKATQVFEAYDKVIVVVRERELKQGQIKIKLNEKELFASAVTVESVNALADAIKTMAGYSKRFQPNVLVGSSGNKATDPAAWNSAYLSGKNRPGKKDEIPDLEEIPGFKLAFLGMNQFSPEVMDGSVAEILSRDPAAISSMAGASQDGTIHMSPWAATVDLIIGVRGSGRRLLLSNGDTNTLKLKIGPIRKQIRRIY